jgi:hypothetical protein
MKKRRITRVRKMVAQEIYTSPPMVDIDTFLEDSIRTT